MTDQNSSANFLAITPSRHLAGKLTLAIALALATGGQAFAFGKSGTKSSEADASVCADAGQWLDPATGETLGPKAVLSRAAAGQVVLLGESHTSSEDHLWQTSVLAGLYAHQPELIVGFEAFPRSVQTSLDEWSSGSLTEPVFLEATRWDQVWGYDADFYMPMFDFARQNRVPVIALNVDRSLVSKVGQNGWTSVPAGEREGLSDPAPASPGYLDALADVYAKKAQLRRASGGDDTKSTSGEDLPIKEQPGFVRFVEAQLTWDRAMAEALAEASRDNPEAVVVGIMGRGHVEHGHGVPHQLADLGIDTVTSLLPVTPDGGCASLEAGLADAVFVVDRSESSEPVRDRPRLGVYIEPASEGGLLLSSIVEGSIAEEADLNAGDIVLNAAGSPVATTRDLVTIIERQAPGTWLPLDIRRDGEDLTIIAKFPAEADAGQ
ncbi:ChaN family lipoprotein [Roseibium sp. MMSF_3544]|uniref:ChaN family lipoprotein n=1 Tax=unclassified Roseibium TaxID=2629323 RepID=UPI00273E95CE|nr:ChaN family lipoprotein [Roseibium sp. MMSF_3544]